ncbi:MAG: MBL fold metallo-hydrolase [bacterium]|nr:MBL fold metallo-hydrolase [bacterium]
MMLSLSTQEQIKKLKEIISRPYALWRRIFPPGRRVYARWLFGLAFVSAALAWQIPQNEPMKVYFFNVGQGDGSLIRVGGVNILIDGGPDAAIVQKLGQVMPFYDHTIDLMILTHPHADHLTGQISVLRRFQVKEVLYTGVTHTTDEYLTWLEEIQKQKVEMEIVTAGKIFDIKSGDKNDQDAAFLEILYPGDELRGQTVIGSENQSGGLNDTSIVFRFIYNKKTFLFMGDASAVVEEKLINKNNDLQADVLKVGHHGSRFSTSKEFLAKIKPRIAVIQVGKNSFGHPAFATLKHLQDAGVKVFRNDKDGDVVIDDELVVSRE